MPPSDALSIHKNMKDTLEGRAVGILIADGTDAAVLKALAALIDGAKGKPVLVAAKVGGAKLSDGSQQKADGQLAGTPSQLFDAVAVVLSDTGTAALLKEAAVSNG
jgi:catalase